METNLEQPEESSIDKSKVPIRKIKFNTYIVELLNGDHEFIKLINDFITQLHHEILYDMTKFKNTIELIFKSVISKILENVLSHPNLTVLISDDIEPTNEFIIKCIMELVYDQYFTNHFFVTNFPNLNLDLIKLARYDENIYKLSCQAMNDAYYRFYFENFCNQTSIDITSMESEYKYLSYSYDIKTSKFNYISHQKPSLLESTDTKHIGCPFIISFTKGVISFDLINHGYIYRIIENSERAGNRFTFFPLTYAISGHDSHACFIVFDNIYKIVFLLDPNGTTNYLTRYITGNDNDEDTTKSGDDDNISLPYIIDAFNCYIDIFNKWNNVDYLFHCELYNNINLNFLSEYSYSYEKGHCQPLILLLVHMLYMHQDMFSDNVPSDLNILLKKLTLNTLTRIKYNFSANLSKIAVENGIIRLD